MYGKVNLKLAPNKNIFLIYEDTPSSPKHPRTPPLTKTHRLFKAVPLLQGERVGLGDDRDDVDHLTESPHELHIQRPQAGGGKDNRTSNV